MSVVDRLIIFSCIFIFMLIALAWVINYKMEQSAEEGKTSYKYKRLRYYMFIPKNPDYKDLWFVMGIKKIKRNFIYVSFFNDEYALKEYDVINIAYAITPEYGIQSDDDLLKYCDFIAESLITEE